MNSDAGGEHFLVKGIGMDPTTTKKNYRQLAKVYLNKAGEIPNNPQVFVWCACPWFKYFCEVALAIRGSSYIINANGALPKITNPTSRPQCCKHMLAFMRKVRSNPQGLKIDTLHQTKSVTAGAKQKDKGIDDLVVARARAGRRAATHNDVGDLGVRPL